MTDNERKPLFNDRSCVMLPFQTSRGVMISILCHWNELLISIFEMQARELKAVFVASY